MEIRWGSQICLALSFGKSNIHTHLMNRFILHPTAPEVSLTLVGGKGVNLAKMLQAGFPVPPSFFVTTAAYFAFIAASGLQIQIEELRPLTRPANIHELGAASRNIRDLFDHGTIPEEVANEIIGAYRHLTELVQRTPAEVSNSSRDSAQVSQTGSPGSNPLFVAVRSSATSEDLFDASFAGQHETFLNVRGETAVLAAIKSCWASLWSTRALAYRSNRSEDLEPISMAIVIQQMIAPRRPASFSRSTPSQATPTRPSSMPRGAWETLL